MVTSASALTPGNSLVIDLMERIRFSILTSLCELFRWCVPAPPHEWPGTVRWTAAEPPVSATDWCAASSAHLGSGVVLRAEQGVLDVRLVDRHGLQKHRGDILDAVVVGRGVVDRHGLLLGDLLDHRDRRLGLLARVFENRGVLLAGQEGLDRLDLGVFPGDPRKLFAAAAVAVALEGR